MAITDLGNFASGGSRTANQSSLTVTTTTAIAAGELLVVYTAVDVAGLSSGIDASTYALRMGGPAGTLFTDKRSNQPGTGSQTGVACTLWWMIADKAYPSGSQIWAGFNSPTESDHSALVGRHYSLAVGNTVVLDSGAGIGWTSGVVTTAIDWPAIDVTTTNTTCLRIRAVGAKCSVGAAPGFLQTSGWVIWPQVFTGPTVSSPDWEVMVCGEHVIFSGTSKASDPLNTATLATAQTSVYVAFKEVPIITGTLNVVEGADKAALFTSAITDLGPLAAGGFRSANQSVLALSTQTDVAAGEFIFVTVAVDNQAALGDFSDASVTSVVLGPLTLTKAHSSGPATAAQTGPGLSVWYGVAPSAIPVLTNFIVTFANAATSDHTALVARHFSIPSGIQLTNAFRNYQDTQNDPPAEDITTPNVLCLRIRSIGSRRPGAVTTNYFNITSSWSTPLGLLGSQQQVSSAQESSPDWEIYAYHELFIGTGTNKVSDPSSTFVTIHANVYVVFQLPPITCTLAATEPDEVASFAVTAHPVGVLVATDGSDTASFTGGVGVVAGTIEAYEGAQWITADSTLYTADDDVRRVNSAGQITDTGAFNGQVITGTVGTLVVTEVADTAAFAATARTLVTLAAVEGADVAAFAVTARMNAALAVTEASDTADFAAAAFFAITGTLAATEAADAAAFTVAVSAFGTLAATEVADTSNFIGFVTNQGTFAAAEGADTVAFTASAAWTATLAVTEVTSDSAAFTVMAAERGAAAATEGSDTVFFDGWLSKLDEKVGQLLANEDRIAGIYAEPRADSTLVTADNDLYHSSLDYYGMDRASFTGGISVTAFLVAQEVGQDIPAFRVNVPLGGILAATEARDVASFAGAVGQLVLAVLNAQEARDFALFSEPILDVKGVLAAVEAADTALFTIPTWEAVKEGAGLRNELQRTIWLTGQGGRVTWLENEVEDTSWLQNLDPEVISLLAEQERITRLGA